METIQAYYFSNKDKKLRYKDNRVIRTGLTHKVKGDVVLCENGLHASIEPIDALQYAPDSYLWVVELSGNIVKGDNKIAARERKYIRGFNADKLLREFARKQALINIEKIKPYTDNYDLIVKYLETGDDRIRSAAWFAARYAADSAAWSAADSAAWSAADSAAWSAARYAAWSAAWSAARYAADSAAWSAADSAAEPAAESSARSAAWFAARSAARSAANDMLKGMINKKLNGG